MDGIGIDKSLIKIALDCHIERSLIEFLKSQNFEIIYIAPPSTPDNVWVESAYLLGANVFISRDLDIGIILDKNEYADCFWIESPAHFKSNKLNKHILNKINNLKI